MKTEIKINMENATFEARREYDAPVSLVWRAYTEAALLDQWWAPKPWKCETQSLEFKPGGKWIYDMVGPNGERHGAIQIINEIEFEKQFSGIDAFTDENGNINEDMPVASWQNSFIQTGNRTLVVTVAKYPNPDSLNAVLKMGMEQGLSMAQDGLDELLDSLQQN